MWPVARDIPLAHQHDSNGQTTLGQIEGPAQDVASLSGIFYYIKHKA
jgi:hypothetical protein